ncbi:hypothetical protein [Modestobacter roseus]|uniref:Uncharacterized protein n=1 Tax=Modestobacter roseus TaxID=1181884 RepID=A0A562IQC6_9ACTN|nr:hypothetical protein [Modestobacter roseus]MQA33220.1 hypothetical protein [Modestobacter roseus]TWH73227.1 hypothetical protein JD78_01750 [Modestobacter roseus]
MIPAALIVLAAVAAVGAGLTLRGERVRTPVGALVLVALLAAAAGLAWRAGRTGDVVEAAAVVLAVAAAALGGGPVAMAVLRAADPQRDVPAAAPGPAAPSAGPAVEPVVGKPAPRSVADPEVLRGGAWIGVLERTVIAGTVLAGWQEGLAVLVAVKGLGRFHEVKAPVAAERFIIGTLASGLWALACVGVGVLLRT